MTEEHLQRRALRRMKLIAGSLLALMVLLFVLAAHFQAEYPWLIWARAFAEAATIGGLADWFAVTALFHRPLGLPIPHTAIIPTNKERIGDDLGVFVQKNFLTEEVLLRKLQQLDMAARLSAWLARPEVAERLGERAQRLAPKILQGFDDQDLRRFLEPNLAALLRGLKAAPLAGTVLTVLVESDKEETLLAAALNLAQQLLEGYEQTLQQVVEQEMPWYIPAFMQHRLFKRLALGLKQRLEIINSDATHPLRRKFYEDLKALSTRLRESAEYLERGELIKNKLLSSQAVQDYFQAFGADVKNRLLQALSARAPDYRGLFKSVFTSLGRQLQQDEQLQLRVNQALENLARNLIQRYRHEAATMVSETVKLWDTPMIVDKIELTVGKDLQYIRLNGTLVGGLIGLLIELIVRLLA